MLATFIGLCFVNIFIYPFENGLPFTGFFHFRLREIFQRSGEFFEVFFGQLVVGKLAGEEGVVTGEVHKAVAAIVKQNHFFFTFFFCLDGFINSGGDGVACFRGADGALCFGPGKSGLVAGGLGIGLWFEESFDDGLANQRRHTVVTQAAGVNRRGDEGVSECIHRQKGSSAGGVAEVVGERPASHCRAGCRLDGHNLDIGAVDFVCNEWERKPREV